MFWYTLAWAATVCFAALTLCFLLVCLYLIKVHWQFSHIPGPKRESFFLGNMPKIRQYYNNGEFTHELYLLWAKEYGPVCRICYLHKCFILLSGPNVIKEVLTNTQYPKAHMTYSRLFSVCGERFLGNGLVTAMDHTEWSRRRAVINPAFHKRFLWTSMSQFNDTADLWMDSLLQKADGKTEFNILDSLSRVTLDMVGQVGLGVDFQALRSEDSPFTEALWNILEGLSAQIRDPLIKLRPSKKEFVSKVRNSVRVLRSHGQKFLQDRLQLLEDGVPIPENILALIIKCKETDPTLTLDDLVDEFCTMLIAGQETTANTIAFLLKEIGSNPQIKQRLVDEIDEVLGDQSHITHEDIGRLEYVSQVVKETLRLYPPAIGTVRETTHETVLNGLRMPPGTAFVVSFFVTHHLDDYFPDPLQFKPERFASDAQRNLYTYMPFSLGHRSCAGRQFAMIEMKVLICKFFRTFDYELKRDQPSGIQETTTLRPKGGTVLCLRTREKDLGCIDPE